jgi:hypothetical protein
MLSSWITRRKALATVRRNAAQDKGSTPGLTRRMRRTGPNIRLRKRAEDVTFFADERE